MKNTVLRILNPLAVIAMVVGGLLTNCDGCGDVHVVGPPAPAASAPGTTEVVSGCPTTPSFTTPSTLTRPGECRTLNNGGLELEISSGFVGICPSGVLKQSAQFQVYWTICNTAVNTNGTALTYDLIVKTAKSGALTELRRFGFTQPTLAPCDCATEAIIFDSVTDPDANKKLSAGSYEFSLSSPYEATTPTKIVVTP